MNTVLRHPVLDYTHVYWHEQGQKIILQYVVSLILFIVETLKFICISAGADHDGHNQPIRSRHMS